MANVNMGRDNKTWDLKITSNDGVNPVDSKLTDPGAKDGLSGTNVTEAFSTDQSIKKMGGFGGLDRF